MACSVERMLILEIKRNDKKREDRNGVERSGERRGVDWSDRGTVGLTIA